MRKSCYLLLALPLLLMSMTCEEYEPETVCIFQNKSQDTLTIVVSNEYPDTLYPMDPEYIIYDLMPGDYKGIQVDYSDWYDNGYVLQLFVYDASIPKLGAYLRKQHVETAHYTLTKEDIRAMEGIVTYPPQPIKK